MAQQTFLFDDTVRGNVTLGADVPDDEVWAALRSPRRTRFVDALPDGLDTRIGERGTTLSGGQRQRLALARALVRRPRLLVLDDATSSVDPQVEARILAGLRDVGGPVDRRRRRLPQATIALADEVVYLEHGRVLDRGTHAELLERCEGYRQLVTAYERAEAERRAMDADGRRVSATMATADERQPVARPSRRGLAADAGVPARPAGHLLLALVATAGRVVVPDRRPADRSTAGSSPHRAGPGAHPAFVLLARARRRLSPPWPLTR